MNDEQPILNDVDGDGAWHPSRRDFLRLFGIGGASFVATGANPAVLQPRSQPPGDPLDSLPPTSTPAVEPAGWRGPGGPTVAELARDLDYGIERIFRFVTDDVQYDPYAGVLRGARGTLWSRAGNSADQAVLLAALLNEALVETRFAVGALDDAATSRVLDTAVVDDETLRRISDPVFAAATAPAPPTDAESLATHDELLAAVPSAMERVLNTSREQLDDAVGTIVGALESASIDIAEPEPALPERERSTHVWVQYASGAEWVDLDPTLAGSERGETVTAVSSTLDTVPDEWRHGVTITLVSEVVAGGVPTEQTLLTYQTFADELVGYPVTVLHAKPEGLAAIGASLVGSLEGSVQYVPTVSVHEDVVIGDGRVTFATGEGLDAVFGEAGNEGDTLAEWIELTITSPDATVQTTRREIFDRVGYTGRQEGAIEVEAIPPVEFVDLDEDTPQEFLPMRSIWSLAITGASVPWDYFDQAYDVVDVFADLGLVSEGYHYVREALQVETAAEGGHRFFADGPNAIAFVVTPTEVTPDGVKLEVALDLLSRTFGAAPMAGASSASHPLITAGVLSHVAERVARGEWRDQADTAVVPPVGVGRVFEEARQQGIAVAVIDVGNLAVDDLDVSSEARSRIAAASAEGFIVIVPERSVDVDGRSVSGWWLVDPNTGATTDRLDDGRGSEFGEHSIPITAEARAIDAFKRLAGCVLKHAATAAIVIGAAGEVAGAGGAGAAAGGLAAVSTLLGQLGDVLGGLELPLMELC